MERVGGKRLHLDDEGIVNAAQQRDTQLEDRISNVMQSRLATMRRQELRELLIRASDKEPNITADEYYRLGRAWEKHRLGIKVMYDEGRDEAIKWYQKAAEQNHVPAQRCLGRNLYEKFVYEGNNHAGTEQAIQWLKKAAKQRDGEVAFYLGRCYLDSRSGFKNLELAETWLTNALAYGYRGALHSLERCLLELYPPMP